MLLPQKNFIVNSISDKFKIYFNLLFSRKNKAADGMGWAAF
jgi:hypothetical protein